jgi:hypothetical protein
MPLTRTRVLVVVGAWCLAWQLASVWLLRPPPGTPNASTVLARTLVDTGEYAVHAWPTIDPADPAAPEAPLRAYLLPGEPLLLAAAFRWLPESAWPYLHVPVTVLLVVAIAAAGLALGGPGVGLVAGGIAAVDPFVVAHGPVWDDTFLAAALEWSLLATLLWALAATRCCDGLRRPWALAAVFAAAGVAALTRAPAQVVLAGVALVVVAGRGARPARPLAAAMLAGVVCALLAWGVRNHVVLGEFFVGSSHDGITLLESTAPSARPGILATGTAAGFASVALAPHVDAARTMRELEADRYFRRAAWRQMRDAPADTALTGVLKIGVSLSGVDFGEPRLSRRNVVAVGWNAVLWALAIVGARRWRGAPDSAALALGVRVGWLMFLVTLGLLVLGPVGLRYRITLAGVLYILAAGALVPPASDPVPPRPDASGRVRTPPAPNDSATT